MAFIAQAVTVLQTLVIALGAGLAVWGVINLMEGYGNDNPEQISGHEAAHGWGGVVLIGTTLVPCCLPCFDPAGTVTTGALKSALPQQFNQLKGGKSIWHFIQQAVTVLQTLVIALGAGLAVWGVINLMEGYGNDNPGAKSQGMKQLMPGWRYPDWHHACTDAVHTVFDFPRSGF
jgi:hypothetical protein